MEKNIGLTNHLKKVVIIGPESTGKSTLASLLSTYFNTAWVPEYARFYLDRLGKPYEKPDLTHIAKGQLQWEDEKAKQAQDVLICDTDLLVIKVWSEHKYGACDPFILEQIKKRAYDLYLLTDIDLPWEEDPQRENPLLRDYFMTIFSREVEQTGVPYIKISGEFYERKKLAIKAIEQILISH